MLRVSGCDPRIFLGESLRRPSAGHASCGSCPNPPMRYERTPYGFGLERVAARRAGCYRITGGLEERHSPQSISGHARRIWNACPIPLDRTDATRPRSRDGRRRGHRKRRGSVKKPLLRCSIHCTGRTGALAHSAATRTHVPVSRSTAASVLAASVRDRPAWQRRIGALNTGDATVPGSSGGRGRAVQLERRSVPLPGGTTA